MSLLIMIKSETKTNSSWFFFWTLKKGAAWEPIDVISKCDTTWNWDEKPDENSVSLLSLAPGQ